MSQVPNAFISPAPEATKFQTDRAVMPKADFLQLPDEARLRAFTIARQTQASILQNTLDALNQHLQEGGTLWTFKEKFPDILAPYREAGREWHLELVVQQNTRQALAVGAYQQRQRVKAAFPYVEYQAGVNPRPSHEALDGKIFGVDDPFLLAHTPPWDFNCNCDLIPRTGAQVGKARQADQGKDIEEQQVVPGNPKLESLAARNKMPAAERIGSGGSTYAVDVAPPALKGGEYSFRPDRLNQDIDLSPYSEELRQRLAAQLKDLGYQISADGMSATAGPIPPDSAPPASPTALKRVAAASSRVSMVAFKAAGAASAAAQRGLSPLGRPLGRLGTPAPQIAGNGNGRVGAPRRAA